MYPSSPLTISLVRWRAASGLRHLDKHALNYCQLCPLIVMSRSKARNGVRLAQCFFPNIFLVPEVFELCCRDVAISAVLSVCWTFAGACLGQEHDCPQSRKFFNCTSNTCPMIPYLIISYLKTIFIVPDITLSTYRPFPNVAHTSMSIKITSHCHQSQQHATYLTDAFNCYALT